MDSCYANPKKLLFWKWDSPHKKKVTYISRTYRFQSGYYTLAHKCANCETGLADEIWTEAQLVSKGYYPKKLQTLSDFRGTTDIQSLKRK